MNWISSEHLLHDRRVLWVTVLFISLLFLLTNLPWQLDDYDQAKQAFTSFEMVKEGHGFYQRTPHERVATKPPLVGWISAGLYTVTRSWDAAWRLPSLVSAAAIAVLLFRAGRNAYGSAGGLLALSAFAMNLLSPRLATLVRTDMPLALVIFMIGLLIWEKLRTASDWDRRDRLLIFALLTAGMLIKGPIIYAFLLPGLAFFQWRRDRIGASTAWPGWWPWLASLAIFLIWVIGGAVFVPQFYDQVIMREFVGRFSETVHRPQPIYFYIPHLLHKFAPWSFLMIALLMLRFTVRSERGFAFFRNVSPETAWLVCWVVGGLLAMSIVPSKRVDRIFPVIPPLCLLLAAQVRDASALPLAHKRVYRWSMAALAIAILISGGYACSKVTSGYRDHRDSLVIFGRNVRDFAAAHHLRYDVILSPDEGLLLYLQKTRFVTPELAKQRWKGREIDAVVTPNDKADDMMGELNDAAVSSLKSTPRKDDRGLGYVLLTRTGIE